MIVIEGPDGSGKSSLIKEIEAEFNVKGKHFGSYPKNPQELHDRVMASKKEVLLDRWSPISEQIYGVLRGSQFSKDVMESYLSQIRPTIIYCRPPRAVMIANKTRCLKAVKSHKTVEQIKLVAENFEAVMNLYDEVMMKIEAIGLRARKFQVWEYDYTNPQALPEILSRLEGKL